jgi:methyl-CpG-binding domain protein 4
MRISQLSYSPPVPHFGLLQEQFLASEWQVLVACIMLNCTTRKQVEKVIYRFFERWPTPEALVEAQRDDVVPLIRSLGFGNRRFDRLHRFSREFIDVPWHEPDVLHAVGKYAHDCWRVLFKGDWEQVEPDDHALVDYHNWLKNKRPRGND